MHDAVAGKASQWQCVIAKIIVLEIYLSSSPARRMACHEIRDLFLTILSFTTISASLLAVALSRLFNQGQVYQSRSTASQPMQVPKFHASNASDVNAYIFGSYTCNGAFYVFSANFTSRTSLPSWTNLYDFFLPSLLDARLPPMIIVLQSP